MRICIFGGAFNPPHLEHRQIVEEIIRVIQPDKLYILPSATPPHKGIGVDISKRLDMCALAFGDVKGVEIRDSERLLPPPNYSVETLKYLRSQEDGEYHFIIGADSMADIDKWYHPEELYRLATIWVCGRSERDYEAQANIDEAKKMGADIRVLPYHGGIVSSSLIRASVEVGASISEYVDENVAHYIYQNNLYRDKRDLVTQVKERIGDKRYAHTVGVVTTAFALNAQLGLPYDKVLLASLLHDIDKYNVDLEHIPEDSKGTEVAHQFSGAYTIEHTLGITDSDILDAVRYHTTGRAKQSDLEKLVYIADMIEPGRSYPEVEYLREIAYKDVRKAYIEGIKASYKFLKEKDRYIYPLTIEAMEDVSK